ncbi:hypothetical protein BKA70DRAFT_1428310 [Coprinopsis sp. MPI-PUGE-AT-0042]|nr:hypothetical protein BKA70DRAFT_1428310 [Coprinopsis sp. MPI-PUGE-AT-0042]
MAPSHHNPATEESDPDHEPGSGSESDSEEAFAVFLAHAGSFLQEHRLVIPAELRPDHSPAEYPTWLPTSQAPRASVPRPDTPRPEVATLPAEQSEFALSVQRPSTEEDSPAAPFFSSPYFSHVNRLYESRYGTGSNQNRQTGPSHVPPPSPAFQHASQVSLGQDRAHGEHDGRAPHDHRGSYLSMGSDSSDAVVRDEVSGFARHWDLKQFSYWLSFSSNTIAIICSLTSHLSRTITTTLPAFTTTLKIATTFASTLSKITTTFTSILSKIAATFASTTGVTKPYSDTSFWEIPRARGPSKPYRRPDSQQLSRPHDLLPTIACKKCGGAHEVRGVRTVDELRLVVELLQAGVHPQDIHICLRGSDPF